jgi:hypothetical protein
MAEHVPMSSSELDIHLQVNKQTNKVGTARAVINNKRREQAKTVFPCDAIILATRNGRTLLYQRQENQDNRAKSKCAGSVVKVKTNSALVNCGKLSDASPPYRLRHRVWDQGGSSLNSLIPPYFGAGVKRQFSRFSPNLGLSTGKNRV